MLSHRYAICTDCRIVSIYSAQQAQIAYNLHLQNRPIARCADGQDGLCQDHRVARHEYRRGTWRTPLPEGQE